MLNSGANQQKLFNNDWQCLKVTLWLEIITVYQTQNNLPFNFSLDIWRSFENIVLTQLQFNKPSKSLLSSFKSSALMPWDADAILICMGSFHQLCKTFSKPNFPVEYLQNQAIAMELLKVWIIEVRASQAMPLSSSSHLNFLWYHHSWKNAQTLQMHLCYFQAGVLILCFCTCKTCFEQLC